MPAAVMHQTYVHYLYMHLQNENFPHQVAFYSFINTHAPPPTQKPNHIDSHREKERRFIGIGWVCNLKVIGGK